MTTKITVEAHCSNKQEVLIKLIQKSFGEDILLEETYLQNGDTHSLNIYGDLYITVREQDK